MPYLLLGLLLLIAVVLATRGFTGGGSGGQSARSARAMRSLRRAVGTLALVIAGLASLRGALTIAVPAAAIGGFLIWGVSAGAGRGGGTTTSGVGRTSEVQTETLEMQLEIDSGAMRGRVRRGEFAGRALDTMTPAEVAALWQSCRFDDPQSAQLLEAYLDAVHPTWRDDAARAQGDAAGGESGTAAEMTRSEALEILGLPETATADDVRRAHRTLMREHHPDRGGDTAMAAKLNEAKDRLLEDG